MRYRLTRLRHYNHKSNSDKFDVLLPQTTTVNILRNENGGILESDLLQYDRHLAENTVHINRALSEGTARALSVQIPDKVLNDGFPLLLDLHVGLECEPTLSFNGSEPAEIISASGDRIPGGQMEGTTIFLVWNARLNKWILMSSDNFTDVTKVVLPVESEYTYVAQRDGEETFVIPGFNRKSDRLTINYGQTVLRAGIDYEYVLSATNAVHLVGFGLDAGDILYCTITTFITTAKRGHYRYELVATDHAVEAIKNNQRIFSYPDEADGAHSIQVNYNQTILRNNLDYEIADDGKSITLKEFALDIGEKIVFTITQFVEAMGEIVPNNWGATGNYRYSLNVVHGSYTATEDHVQSFTVPGFNFKKDDISIIKDNKLYILDVDYTIDSIGYIVLLKTELNTGDEIFYTILQGAMMDVPNFNVIQGRSQEGKHVLLDMSYSVLCDFYTLLVRLDKDLKSAPTLKCIDGPAEPICDCYKNPIPGGYKAGTFLWVVYSEQDHVWYSLSHGQYDLTQLIPTYKHASGTANFLGQDDPSNIVEVTIPHNLGVKPDHIEITPCEPPTVIDDELTTIGDIWSYADAYNLYVGNSGKSKSKFTWTVSTD